MIFCKNHITKCLCNYLPLATFRLPLSNLVFVKYLPAISLARKSTPPLLAGADKMLQAE